MSARTHPRTGTAPPPRSGLPGAVRPPGRRRPGLALIVIATAQLMVVLDASIVNVALPHIQRALGFSGTNLEWVVNAYALAFGGLLLPGGRAGHPVTPAAVSHLQAAIYRHALASGFSRGFEVSAGILLLALIVTIAAIRVRRGDLDGTPG